MTEGEARCGVHQATIMNASAALRGPRLERTDRPRKGLAVRGWTVCRAALCSAEVRLRALARRLIERSWEAECRSKGAL